MEKIKIVVSLFAISFIFSVTGVNAAYHSFIGITIPSMSGTYTSDSVYKNTISNQTVKKNGAKDNLSGDERAIQSRLNGIGASYIDVATSYRTLANNGSLGQIPGDYKIEFKAKKWTASSVTFSGSWILDN